MLDKDKDRLCENCKHIKRHNDRDGTLLPLFYCEIYKCDLIPDFIGRFKRPDGCSLKGLS